MNKRKIFTLALAVMMVAILAVGGSLAYLTDTDSETNVFTTGNVAIDLYENFTQDSKLLPATGSAQEDTLQNGVTKEVFVTNTGSEDAYVRVHIALPRILDNGRPDFDAGKNVLHFNYDDANIGENKWDWTTTTGAPYEYDWNFYETTITTDEGLTIDYNVYVVTYEKVLEPGESTVSAMHQVYLDGRITNEDITKINEELGLKWKIYVAAEAAQVEGFADAYEALNTAFGVPGDNYVYTWEQDNATIIDTVAGGEEPDKGNTTTDEETTGA